jgi:two-component system OmpR family response regulator
MTPLPQLQATGRRVLVVDDDPDARELVTTRLQLVGCVTAIAGNGHEAIRQITAFRPEAMVLELNLPQLDGFGVLQWMTEKGLTLQVRTLVLTARNDPADVARAIGLGARDYLAKPFKDEQLLLRVARLLVRSREALRR